MNTRFDGIAEFVAAARLGSFTAAAAELGVTKSAVGRAISKLETRLKAKLLHRTTRRLTLTSDGEAWLKHSVAALAELDRGEDVLSTARQAPSGRVRIDLPSALGRLFIMPLLLKLVEQYPALMLNVSFTDRRADIIGEGLDLVVRIGALDDLPDVVARTIGTQRLVICGSPNYLAARGTPLNANDLGAHDCIVGWPSEYNVAWLLKQPDGSVVRHVIPVKHEIHDYEMMLAAVRAGCGLAQLPLWLADRDIRLGTLIPVLGNMSGGELPISILWPRTRTVPAKVRVLINGITKCSSGLTGSVPSALG